MLDWLDVLKISGPVAVAVTGLLGNEYFKRKWEKYKRKEERYVAMLESLKGFAVNADPRTAEKDKNEFIQKLNTAHLYCPDAIINAAYEFLSSVHVGANRTEDEKQEALKKFVAEISRDLHGRFRKKKSEFRFLSST